MPRRKKTQRRKKVNPTLAVLFKMTREELRGRKVSGGGVHRPKVDEALPRGEQKRRAVKDQVE